MTNKLPAESDMSGGWATGEQSGRFCAYFVSVLSFTVGRSGSIGRASRLYASFTADTLHPDR